MKKKWELPIREWEDSLRYSDPEKIEIRTLLSSVNFFGEKVLDVGCGIGRLAVPISKYAKKVVAIDKEKEVIAYCKRKKARKNIEYLTSDIRKFKRKDFDVAIFAQPDYDFFNEKLRAIHSLLNKNGVLVVIRWIDNGNEYNKLLEPFWNKNKACSLSVKDFSSKFMASVKKLFIVKKIKLIRTYDSYPSEGELAKSIIRDSPINFSKTDKNKADKLLSKYNHKKIKITMKLYTCTKK